MGKIKTKSIDYMDFWNDEYDIRIYFKPKEVEPPQDIAIPTNIMVTTLTPPEPTLPLIPTNIKLQYGN